MNLGNRSVILGLNFALFEPTNSCVHYFGVKCAIPVFIFCAAVFPRQTDKYSLAMAVENKTMFPAEFIVRL